MEPQRSSTSVSPAQSRRRKTAKRARTIAPFSMPAAWARSHRPTPAWKCSRAKHRTSVTMSTRSAVSPMNCSPANIPTTACTPMKRGDRRSNQSAFPASARGNGEPSSGRWPSILPLEGQRPLDGSPLPLADAGNALWFDLLSPRFIGVHAVVGMFAGEQFIGDTAERVDIVTLVRCFALEHFQAGVGRCERAQAAGIENGAIVLALFAVFRLRDCAGDTEVEDLCGSIAGDEDVARLEVRVNYVLLVGVDQGR